VNYLAHLLLAEPGEEARLGALLGDFMRGQQLADLAPAVQEGVRLHREVDRFTEFYDHFLASRWEAWCEQPLSEFAADVYGMLERRLPELPPRMQYVVPFMIQQDWLTSYRETRHVERALRGMSRRVKRENPLAASAAELEAHYPALGGDFDEFFPQLVTAHAGGRAMVRSQS
jgi:acyl carrier protein phosphodiesterase